MDGARQNKISEVVQSVKLLAESDWGFDRLCQASVAIKIVIPQRFLKPENIVVLESATELNSGWQIPFAIGIYHQLEARPNRFAHSCNAFQVKVRIRAPNFDLHTLISIFDQAFGVGH